MCEYTCGGECEFSSRYTNTFTQKDIKELFLINGVTIIVKYWMYFLTRRIFSGELIHRSHPFPKTLLFLMSYNLVLIKNEYFKRVSSEYLLGSPPQTTFLPNSYLQKCKNAERDYWKYYAKKKGKKEIFH